MSEKKKRIEDLEREEMKFLADLESIDLDRNWNEFRDKLKEKPGSEIRKVQRSKKRMAFFAMAASLVALISVALTLMQFGSDQQPEIQRISASGSNSDLLLEDGTEILLKQGSQLSFPQSFSKKRRELDLIGEAFFEVAASQSAFLVHTQHTTVEVKGTAFNVRETPDGDVTVSVLSGEVAFSEKVRGSDPLILGPGTEGIFKQDQEQLSKREIQNENFLFWKSDSLAFKNEPLESVFASLERHFGVIIHVTDEKIMKNRLSTSFTNQDIISVMDELSILFEINYTIRQDTIIASLNR